jgi:hypothetical protein
MGSWLLSVAIAFEKKFAPGFSRPWVVVVMN